MIYLEIYKHNGITGTYTRIDEITAFSQLNWFRKSSGVSGIGFLLNIFDKKATLANLLFGNVVVVKNDNAIEHVGWITDRTASKNNETVTISCIDIVGRLSRFDTTQETVYTNQDAGDIAMALITEVQSRTGGNLGIVEGTIAATTDRDRTYRYKEIGGAITDLSDVIGGFDFEFVPQSNAGRLTGFVFNVAAELGSLRTDLPKLVEGENITNLDVVLQNLISNAVTSTGEGFGELAPSEAVEDSGSIASYARYEKTNKYSDVSVSSNLLEKANEFLNDNKNEKQHIEFSIMPNSNIDIDLLHLGDTLVIDTKSDAPILAVVGFARLVELAYDVDEEGVRQCHPKVEFYR